MNFGFKTIKNIFNILITALLSYFIIGIPFVAEAIKENSNLYVIIPLAVYIGLWIIGIIKQIITTIITILIIVLIIGGYSISQKFENKTCLNDGDCKTGLTIPTQYGDIKINHQNCLKYKWIWNEDNKSCKININIISKEK